MKLKISMGIIEDEIKENFRNNFDPQIPRLDYSAEFIIEANTIKYNFEIPY